MELNFYSLTMYFAISFAMNFTGLAVIYYLRNKDNFFVNKILSIPARKSETSALQLGGLPIAICLSFLFFEVSEFGDYSSYQKGFVFCWSVISFAILCYGYLDDLIEISAVSKLYCQFACAFTCGAAASFYLFQFNPIAWGIITFFSMAVYNGNNLIDGIDTISVKYHMMTFILVALISYENNNHFLLMTSVMTMAALSAFYFFNKEPAKIHLGEIGGIFLGHIYILSAVLVLYGKADGYLQFKSLGEFALVVSLPVVELNVSFFRRLFNGQSPFRGDRYHLHHILTLYKKMSPSKAASIMAFSYGASLFIAYLIGKVTSEFTGVFVHYATITVGYYLVGRKYWFEEKDIVELNEYMKKDAKLDVMLIDFKVTDDISFSPTLESRGKDQDAA